MGVIARLFSNSKELLVVKRPDYSPLPAIPVSLPVGYTRVPYTNVAEEDGSIVIKSELPGVSPDEIDITLKDGVITIEAGHRENEEEGSAYQALKYCRSMTLPPQIDAGKVSAIMEHGLLEVRFPKAEALDAKYALS